MSRASRAMMPSTNPAHWPTLEEQRYELAGLYNEWDVPYRERRMSLPLHRVAWSGHIGRQADIDAVVETPISPEPSRQPEPFQQPRPRVKKLVWLPWVLNSIAERYGIAPSRVRRASSALMKMARA